MAAFSTKIQQPLGYTMIPYTPAIRSTPADLYGRGLIGLGQTEPEPAKSLSWGTWTAVCLVVLGALLVNNAIVRAELKR